MRCVMLPFHLRMKADVAVVCVPNYKPFSSSFSSGSHHQQYSRNFHQRSSKQFRKLRRDRCYDRFPEYALAYALFALKRNICDFGKM
ncbi:Hypothetical predicted protein [Octopus vulgaris]|uniref:Uncharacterized protein n=1 Tax=Octopus vulgaris TaxID=6645 RepID=A0AA36FFZ8_OCTVU|nr:Hypothetical predicted protein [Octopus vulgaris]